MSEHDEEPDAELAQALAAALAAAAEVPASFVAAGRASYTWRRVDSELAEILRDSAESGLVGVRAGEGSRTLSIRTSHHELELEIGPGTVHGQVVPAEGSGLRLEQPGGGEREVEVDELGWFVVDPPPQGLFRLVLLGADTQAHTPWLAPARR